MSEIDQWNEYYATGFTPWDSGRPSRELARVLDENSIPPGRALELGCGTGTNAVYLARRGFEVTALDVALLAVERATQRARESKVNLRVLHADVLNPPDLGPAFDFVFDRGVYHHLRQHDLDGFRRTLARTTRPGAHYLVLAGNSDDTGDPKLGPPRVPAQELCAELTPLFRLLQLRAFRFDGVVIEGQSVEPLAWSGLFVRRDGV